ncbi:ADOP family duplicated permease [Gemmatimonadota bacterium]
MAFRHRWQEFVHALLQHRQLEEEMDSEIDLFLEMAEQRHRARGLDPDAARRAARLEFGGTERIRQQTREERTFRVFRDLATDIRFGARLLVKQPIFTGAAVTILALGIGLTTTVFSVVQTVILNPFPYPEPDLLVRIYEVTPQGRTYTTSEPTLLDWQASAHSFAGIGAYTWSNHTLTGDGEPESLSGGAVTHNLLSILGVEIIHGRGFLPNEDEPGAERVVLLGEGLWKRRFASDPEVIGRTLTLAGDAYTVIGIVNLKDVMLIDTELLEYLVPLAADPAGNRGNHYLTAIGRLGDGMTTIRAQEEMEQIAARMSEQYTASNGGWGIQLVSLHEWLIGPELSRNIFVLFSSVGVLLLLACVNVSILLLARGTARLREIGVRSVLGAGRARLIRQLLTEHLLLAVSSAALGYGLTVLAVPVIRTYGPQGVKRLGEISTDPGILLFAIVMAVLTCLIFGLGPALRSSQSQPAGILHHHGRTFTASGRSQHVLVIMELALAVVILIGAGLTARSFLHLQQVDPGYNPDGVYATRLLLPPNTPNAIRIAGISTLEERLQALPGVSTVGSAYVEPFLGSSTSNRIAAVDANPRSPDDFIAINWRIVTPGFREVMQIPLRKGRFLDSRDDPPYADGADTPIVITANLASALWPDSEPIDRRIHFGRLEGPVLRVVGIVGDIRDNSIEEARPTLFVPYGSQPWNTMTVLFRLESDPAGVIPAVRDVIRAVGGPDLPIPAIRPIAENMRGAVATPRFLVRLFGIFAVLALVLATLGIYAVMVFIIGQRKHEIGVRMALGAAPGEILAMILRTGMYNALKGIGIGMIVAFGLSRLMTTILFDTAPTDLLTWAVVILLLLSAAITAMLIPAIRATRIDPCSVLARE